MMSRLKTLRGELEHTFFAYTLLAGIILERVHFAVWWSIPPPRPPISLVIHTLTAHREQAVGKQLSQQLAFYSSVGLRQEIARLFIKAGGTCQ